MAREIRITIEHGKSTLPGQMNEDYWVAGAEKDGLISWDGTGSSPEAALADLSMVLWKLALGQVQVISDLRATVEDLRAG